jgi:hypothetical protein
VSQPEQLTAVFSTAYTIRLPKKNILKFEGQYISRHPLYNEIPHILGTAAISYIHPAIIFKCLLGFTLIRKVQRCIF